MTDPNALYKISEQRLLVRANKDTCGYFIKYLAYILKYVEREKNSNYIITDFGLKSLDLDLKFLYKKFEGKIDGKKVTQNELSEFCLYFYNGNKICERFLHIIALYKQDTDEFKKNYPLPDCVLDDFITFEDIIVNLSGILKNVIDRYITFLGPTYKSKYHEYIKKSFL